MTGRGQGWVSRLRARDAGTVDRVAWLTLAAAGVLSAALILWLNRGGTFFIDEVKWFAHLGGENDLTSILLPNNSHLHGTIRALFLLTMETVGTDYAVFRVLGVISVLLCSGLFFALAKRRIGTMPALVPSILLLFYGSAWQHVVVPIGFTVLFSIAAGLGALLALERDDRRGDVIACAAVALSVFTFTVGLGFLVGVAISVLIRRDRLRRAWVFAVPLVLYSAWWLWALQFDEGRTSASQITEIVPFIAGSLALTTGSLTGLNLSLDGAVSGDILQAPPSLGWLTAVALVVALVWRFRRGNVSTSLYVSLGIVLTYWVAGALADTIGSDSQVYAVRYVYPGSIGVLLVITDAARGLTFGRKGMIALLAVGTVTLALNLGFLRDGATYYRAVYTPQTKAGLAMFELGSGFVPGSGAGQELADARPVLQPSIASRFVLSGGPYLTAVARYGSPSFTLEELRSQPPSVRSFADSTLIGTYALAIAPPAEPGRRTDCEVVRPPTPFELPPGGALLRPRGSEPAQLSLSRFGDRPGLAVGTLPAAQWSLLRIPTDDAPERWSASVGAGEPLVLCALA